MKLLFVRHGDPDYVHDTLTERGWQEANALVSRFAHMDVTEFFVSPLGRAKDTASCTLNALHRTAEVCDWLQEFPARVEIPEESCTEDPDSCTENQTADISACPQGTDTPGNGHAEQSSSSNDRCRDSLSYAYPDKRVRDGVLCANVVWDVLPGYWTRHPEYYHPTRWRDSLIARSGDLLPVYDSVTAQFDRLLAEHGYIRSGCLYEARQANRETLVFFCHYGITCVLLSHLMHVSPFVLWHSLVLAPSSVSTMCTEEREQGIAYFRSTGLGDISHLFAAGIEPSFSARFCETWDNPDERH